VVLSQDRIVEYLLGSPDLEIVTNNFDVHVVKKRSARVADIIFDESMTDRTL
jgi:hypothetical protein